MVSLLLLEGQSLLAWFAGKWIPWLTLSLLLVHMFPRLFPVPTLLVGPTFSSKGA